ncbi:GW dipeptide domain-containing protein [Jeotgalibaca sp. A122]|uniref:GW dipeptide domain-containing protein n=1 Tax=Jeotgalibaca sp. A122 TaxID=3457322 RepID=UPI003FCF74F5
MSFYNKRTRNVLVTMSSIAILSAVMNDRKVLADTITDAPVEVSHPVEIPEAETNPLVIDDIYEDSEIISGSTIYNNQIIQVLINNEIIYTDVIDAEGRFSLDVEPFAPDTVLTIQVIESVPEVEETLIDEKPESESEESGPLAEETVSVLVKTADSPEEAAEIEEPIEIVPETSEEAEILESVSSESEEMAVEVIEEATSEEVIEPSEADVVATPDTTEQPKIQLFSTFATTSTTTAKTPLGTEYHYVRSGETLKLIAQEYGVTVDKLVLWNDIKNTNLISVGQILSVNGFNNYSNIDKETRTFANTEEFISFLAPGAQKAATENNIYASVIIAQAIHESGHGKSALAVSGNNLFGIKGSYNGNTINMLTWEDDGFGNAYWIVQPFRLYPSYAESLLDNADKIRNGVSWDPSYYRGAWVENTASHLDATEWLTGRYATDTKYNLKVNDTIDYYSLTKYDTHVKITNPITSQQNLERRGILTGSGYTIFEQPKGSANSTINYSTNSYLNQEVTINKEKINDLGTWWHISVNGKALGYVLKQAVSDANYVIHSNTPTNYGATIKYDWSINTLPYGVEGFEKVATGSAYYDKELVVVREAKTDKGTYGLINLKGKDIGWIDTGALDELRVLSTKKVDYYAVVAKPWSINTQPWGTRGYVTIANDQSYLNRGVRVIEEKTTQRSTYGLIQLDGVNIGWIDLGALSQGAQIISSVNVSYAADLKIATPIYSKPAGLSDATEIGNTKSYLNKTVTADLEQATSSDTFVRISLNGKELGFVKKSDLSIHNVLETKSVNYDAKIVKSWSINTQPWGTPNYTLVDSGSNYIWKNAKVTLEKVTSRSTYAYIEVGGKGIGWIDKGALSAYNSVLATNNVNYVAKVIHPWSINTQPWGTLGATEITSAKGYIGKNIDVIQEKVTEKSSYALIKLDGKELGWIDVTGIEKLAVSSSTPVDYEAKVSKAWSINTQPWGTEGYQLVDDGSSYLGKTVRVVEEQTTQRSTYALLQTNGINIGWIDKGALSSFYTVRSTKDTSYLAEVIHPWSINSAPWGTAGATQVANGRNYIGKMVEVIQEKTTDKSTYALIVVDGKEVGWIDKTGIDQLRVTYERDIRYAATVTKSWSINTAAWGTAGSEVVDNQGTYVGQDFEIQKEVMTQKAVYAKLQIGDNVLGWIDTTGISRYVVLSTRNVDYNAKVALPWSINTQPWGTLQYQPIDNYTSYVGKDVRVIQEKTTRKGSYGLIQIDGKNIGWIDTGALSK